MVAYISKHRDGDAHMYCEDWPTPVALDLDEWVCAKPTDDPCVSDLVCIKLGESEQEQQIYM